MQPPWHLLNGSALMQPVERCLVVVLLCVRFVLQAQPGSERT